MMGIFIANCVVKQAIETYLLKLCLFWSFACLLQLLLLRVKEQLVAVMRQNVDCQPPLDIRKKRGPRPPHFSTEFLSSRKRFVILKSAEGERGVQGARGEPES